MDLRKAAATGREALAAIAQTTLSNVTGFERGEAGPNVVRMDEAA